MTIYFIDKGDAGLSILVSTCDNPVPNVRSEDHSRPWRLFNRAVRQISRKECGAVAESHCRSIGRAIENIFAVAHWIKDRFGPRLTVELQLEPLVVINCFQKLISDVH